MRFNTVKLNSVYFTEDGSQTGTKCKLAVAGLDALKKTRPASIQRDLNNVPYRQQSDFAGKGFDLSITVETLTESVFSAINDEINAACENETSLTLEISGDTGDFNLTVIPAAESVRFPGTFINSRIKQVTYSFVTV